jgi:hypothetical protein
LQQLYQNAIFGIKGQEWRLKEVVMLVEFRFQNFLSFKEPQSFTMVKSKSGERPVNAFSIMPKNEFSLLKSAAVYGPNASGKSHFLQALAVMKGIVTTAGQHGMKLPLVPFRLHPETANQPSEFEVSFIVRGVKYQYGFSASYIPQLKYGLLFSCVYDKLSLLNVY